MTVSIRNIVKQSAKFNVVSIISVLMQIPKQIIKSFTLVKIFILLINMYYGLALGYAFHGMYFMVNQWNELNYWLSCMTLSGTVRPLNIMEALEAKNIESRPIWKPMHIQPFFAEYDYVGGGVSEKIFENGVYLPSDAKMTDGDLERIVEIIKGLWN